MRSFEAKVLQTLLSAVGDHLSEAGVEVANDQVGTQWQTGLPPRAREGIEWRQFGGLRVGLASRHTLIDLKLVAAADGSPASKHAQDLVALNPTDAELARARAWAIDQDAFEGFGNIVDQVIEHVRSRRDH